MKSCFKGSFIGITDINGMKVFEGDTVKFKSRLYNDKEFEGVVIYNSHICAFRIDRGVEIGFGFGSEIFDIEVVVNTSLNNIIKNNPLLTEELQIKCFKNACVDYQFTKYSTSKDKKVISVRRAGTAFAMVLDVVSSKVSLTVDGSADDETVMFYHELTSKVFKSFKNYISVELNN